MTERLGVYIAGPMRGIEEFNFPAFYAAEAKIDPYGTTIDIFNPARYDVERMGFDPIGKDGNEDLDELRFDLRKATARDHQWIATHADAVACLPGWENSKGAGAEVALALSMGLIVFELEPERAPSLTKREAAVISAYTGYLMTNFGDMQEYAEEALGRPLWTHDFGREDLAAELRLVSKAEFLDICAGVI